MSASRFRIQALAVGLLLMGASAAHAQGVIPDAPTINDVLPPSAQRGTTAEIVLNGQKLNGTLQLLCRFSAYPTLAPPVERGIRGEVVNASEAQIRARLIISAETPPGLHEIRALTAQGITAPVYFYVSQYAQVSETEPNTGPAQANTIQLPATIAGQINGGEDQDTFAFQARAGETLIFDVEGFKRYAPAQNQQDGISYLDPFLLLRDAGGNELAFDDDSERLDAFLAYKFTADGKYTITLRDTLYRGRGDFHYRLTIGPRPTITAIFPPGGTRGTRQVSTVFGYNLNSTGATSLRMAIPLGESAGVQEFRVSTAGGISNAFPVVASAELEVPETEPNNRIQDATLVTVPFVGSGKFDSTEDVDGYRFQAQGGQLLIIESMAARLGSRVDTYLLLTNRSGTVIARDDDGGGGQDARIEVTVPQTDEYCVFVRNQAKSGAGPEFYYRLTVRPRQPGYAPVFKQEGVDRQGRPVKIPVDGISVPAGGNIEFDVDLNRREGQTGPVTISLSLPPDLKGLVLEQITRTNPKGGPVTPTNPDVKTTIDKNPTFKDGTGTVTLRLTADEKIDPKVYLNTYLKLTGMVGGQPYSVNKPLWLTISPKS